MNLLWFTPGLSAIIWPLQKHSQLRFFLPSDVHANSYAHLGTVDGSEGEGGGTPSLSSVLGTLRCFTKFLSQVGSLLRPLQGNVNILR